MTQPPRTGPGEEPGFDKAGAGVEAREFFDRLWSESDPWNLDTSDLDQVRFQRQLELLGGRHYQRGLEIGCAGGAFTRRLAETCGELVGIDISQHAIAKARAAIDGHPGVELRVANVMELDLEQEGTWDLVVLTETSYYLGWLYPMFDVGWLAHSLHDATRAGGRLLLANTISTDTGIMSPWLIRAYRDLFANVGYELETEEVLRGTKETVEFEILLTLFRKHA